MALPSTAPSSWTQNAGFPSRLFEFGGTDYELYEDDKALVISVEMPGFDVDEIDVNWYEGRLDISAEHEDDARGQRKTYHRTFRMPKEIEPEEIEAQYRNGVLEVRLPIIEGATARGTSIEVTG